MDTEFLPAASAFATIGEFGQVDYTEQNKGITPLFFIETVQNGRRSETEGRPVFDELERVKILVAGDPWNVVVRPVDDEIKARFDGQYRRWQESKRERYIDGTPLREWPPLSRSQIAELESLNIFSVEALASVADANLSKIYDGRAWRAKAEAWLKTSKDGAATTKLAAENERLRADVDELRKTIADLSARIPDHDEEERPRRGRPPKAA